jgi:hypothetical protein
MEKSSHFVFRQNSEVSFMKNLILLKIINLKHILAAWTFQQSNN